MQTYLGEQFPDPPSDLDQTNTQGIELHPARAALHELPPQGVQQPVGASVQQQPKLVGHKPMATEAIRLEVELEVLYPVLCFSPASVELVKLLGLLVLGANHEAPVDPLLHGFGLVDDPALLLPTRSPIGILTEEASLLARPFVLLCSCFEQIFGHLFEALVGDQRDGVAYALPLAVVVEGWHGEAGVGPYLYLDFGPSLSQSTHDALQDGHRGVRGVGVSCPQERRYEMPALAVEDDQRMVDVMLVVAVVVTTFLLPVGGIVRRVEVQQHPRRSAARLPLSHVELEENSGYSVARAYRGRVLHPRDGRLRGEVLTALGQRAARHLQQGIFPQGVRVVLVFVAARYLQDALPDERDERMASPPVSPLGYALADGLAQTQFGVHLREPEEPAV